MPVAEVFLGAFLQVLFDRLASPKLLNFARHTGIYTQLKKWEKMLISINQVLDDAEDRQLNGDLGVKSWLEDLRNLAYDIEDLLDKFATESAENKSEAEPGTIEVLSSLFPSPRSSSIEEMDRRLQEIITLKDDLSLREKNGKRSEYRQRDKRDSTTNLPEACFFSREDEKLEILKLLIPKEDDRTYQKKQKKKRKKRKEEEDDGTCADQKVIAIVGMPGVGKTALTQQVFNDDKVATYFNVRAWACVSVDFDELAITKSILQKTNSTLPCEGKDLDWLQDRLKESLAGKKFLVVLDDVWNEKTRKWTKLLKPFQSGAKGSKIIITTRNLLIAKIAHAVEYPLNLLSPDACMKLLAFHALGVGNFDHHPDLQVSGRKIAEKCKGLPLAAIIVGGLLSSNVSPHEWEDISDSNIWDLAENEILPALKISYLHLPSNLRRCFAYCAIFPNDYEIERDQLIHWWIAEGLLEGQKGKNRWNAGLKYFNELVSRSLFQKSNSNGSRFLMHDLVNELAKSVAGATHFSSGEFEFEGHHNNASLARHASFISSSSILSKKFKIYHEMKGLRSFISLRKQSIHHVRSHLSPNVLRDLLLALKYLRVLSLSHYHIREVPECIDTLRHLKHLNLSYTDIKTLPESIVVLYNLEALMLRGCQYLIELPKGMEKLINLRFLDISDTKSLQAMPLFIGNLVGLEMLSKFVVGTENGSRLKELKNLENLGGELCISDLHKVREADAKDANLCMKKGICQLTMQWSTDSETSRNEQLEAKVLGFLHPHQNLENLEISYYGGLEFPSWIENPSHVNIVHLRLHKCCKVKALPSLGQLSSLKELYIEGLDAICTVGSKFYGIKSPFPSLITLKFKDMPLWEDWSHCIDTEKVRVVFPRLEHLIIQNCPRLIGSLPSQVNSLIKLEINSCPCMDASGPTTSLPSLHELKFRDCKEGVLKRLVNLKSLAALVIKDVADLTYLHHEFTSSLTRLEKLEMESCEKLTDLWQDRDVIRNLARLKSLVVKSCREFKSFVASEGNIELPKNLETIHLSCCANLEKLPSKMHTLSSLRHLRVDKCPKLVSFPEAGISTSVMSLFIRDCKMLQSLPRGLSVHPNGLSNNSSNNHCDMTSCLQELTISLCDSLLASQFSKCSFLPATLKRLAISDCKGVKSLAEINVDRCQSLREIEIVRCENLRSLPQGLLSLSHLTSLRLSNCPALELECFPPLPPGILSFTLVRCPKIKSLPNELHRLTCFRDLIIRECESITRFPDGGLPPQLQRLELASCEILKQPMTEWLTPHTSLQRLTIIGIMGGAGEEEDLLLPLPSSLLHLEIYGMRNVERLCDSLPPNLQTLWICDWPKLRKLPQDGLPPSLQSLKIFNCPKLAELPQDGLLPSLEQLWIRCCGILEERCKEPSGCYWPRIREIPEVDISHFNRP